MPARAPLTTRSSTTSTVSSDNLNKGSGLTNAEMDSNFINLRDQTIGIVGDDSTGIDVKAGDTIKFTGSGGATVSASGDTVTITAGGGGSTSDSFKNIAVSGQSTVVADSATDTLTLVAGTGMTITTDAGTDTITFTSSSGTGDLIISGSEISTTNSAITLHPKSTSASGGTGNLNIGVNTATSVPDIVFRDIINYDSDYHGGVGPSDYISTGGIINAITCSGDLLLGAGYTNQAGTEDSTNNIVLDARLTRIYGNGTNAILTTAQGNDLVLTVQESNDSNGDANIGVNSGLIRINDGNNANIEIKPHGTGNIILDNHTWPNTDGTTGQVLSTNGSGVLSWVSGGGGGGTGDLNIVGTTISTDVTNADITISPNGTGKVNLTTDKIVITEQTLGGISEITTNSTTSDLVLSNGDRVGTLSWITIEGGTLGDIHANLSSGGKFKVGRASASGKIAPYDVTQTLQIEGGSTNTVQLLANGSISIQTAGSGNLTLDGAQWPKPSVQIGEIPIGTAVGVLSYVSGKITFVGDDSTGTDVTIGETFKIAGTQNVTTAVSGDTLTITGPNLSSYLTSVAFGDLTSTPTTLSGYGITDAVASGSAALTLVGDDSTGTTVSIGETFKIAGAGGVTTVVSGDTLTITGPTGTLSNIVEDTTPQLGGNLDVQTHIITTSTTNGNVKLKGDGTGRVIIGSDSSTGSTGFYGNNSVYGAQMNFQNTAWNAATGPQYPNPLTRSTDWTLDASTTTNGILRMIDAVELNLAGYNWNFSTDTYSGPQQQKSLVLKNTGSSASNTLDNAIVNFNKAEIQGSGSNNSTITVNQIFGERIQTIANQDSGDTANIGSNYGLHYASPANYGSGTLNVTNEYGVYVDMTSSTATNNDAIRIDGDPDNGVYFTGTSSNSYGFRTESNAPNNRIGGIQLQFNRIKFPTASDPGTVSSLAWLYGKNTTGTQELYVKDGAGNITQLSPHNAQGEWEYFSRNTETGKVVRINMEEMIRDIEQLTGKTYIKNE